MNILENKLILLFLFIALVLIVVYFVYNQKLSKSVSDLTKMKNNILEGYSNTTLGSSGDNLLTNGSFSNGQNVMEFSGSNGINNIVTMNNPSDGDYVLKQKQSGELTYYKISIDTAPSQNYSLTFWVRFSQLSSSNIDFTNLIKINTQDSNSINSILDVKYTVNKKMVLSNNNTWYNVSYTFVPPTSTKSSTQTLNIYLNYSTNLQATYIYFTDLSLYRVISGLPSFTVTNGLTVFLSGKQYSTAPVNKQWLNLVDNSSVFTWANTPISSETEGYISTLNNSLSYSQPKSALTSDSATSFSVSLVFNKDLSQMSVQENFVPSESTMGEESELSNVLSISGNNGKAIQLFMPNGEGKIKVVYDSSTEYTAYSSRSLVFYNKTVITLTYQNSTISVYQDAVPVLSLETGVVHLDNNPLVINSDGTWDVNLYNVLAYNMVLTYVEMGQLSSYFSNSDSVEGSQFVSNGESVSEYDGQFEMDMDNSNLTSFGEQLTDSNYGSCLNDCNNLCSKFIDTSSMDSMDEFNKCRRSCKNTVKSCQTFCTNNPDNRLCQLTNCSGSLSSDGLCDVDVIQSECPVVYKKNGVYMVYVQSDTPYAKELGYSGEKSYGYNRESAAAMFKQNFPSCDVPDILKVGEGKNLKETCPFIIKENNPCYMSNCEDVDWESEGSMSEMSDKCKFGVSNYCEINKDLDDACLCWREGNRHKPECVNFRRQFQNPSNYMCNASDFPISEHPDFKKYIRRDSIPCWGCSP